MIKIENRISAAPVRSADFSNDQLRICGALGLSNISTDALLRKPLQYQNYESRFNHHTPNDPSCEFSNQNSGYSGQYGTNNSGQNYGGNQGHPGQYGSNNYGQNYGGNQGQPGQYGSNNSGQNYGGNQGHPGQYGTNNYGQNYGGNQGHSGQYGTNNYGQNYGGNQGHPGQYGSNNNGQNPSANPYVQNSPFRNTSNGNQNNSGMMNQQNSQENQYRVNNRSGMQPASDRNASPAGQTPVQTPPPAPKRNRSPLPPANKILKKGEKYSITKNHPGVNRLRIGIGWDMAVPVEYDMDLEAFLLNDTEKVPDDSWIVYYGQLRSPDSSVTHRGDSGSGNDFGPDCEQIDVYLNSVNPVISKIAFVLTINEAKKNRYNFSGIKNAYIRITDISTNKELVRYELTDYYREVVSMVVGEMYLRNGEWRFNPVGMGTADDLEGLCNRYGIEVND